MGSYLVQQVLDQFIDQLARFEHSTTSPDSEALDNFIWSVVKLTCGWAPMSTSRPPGDTHMMRPSVALPFLRTIVNANCKNGVGEGEREKKREREKKGERERGSEGGR